MISWVIEVSLNYNYIVMPIDALYGQSSLMSFCMERCAYRMLSQNPTNVKWKNPNSNKQHKSKDSNDQ
jgi:DNA relaxase NicK